MTNSFQYIFFFLDLMFVGWYFSVKTHFCEGFKIYFSNKISNSNKPVRLQYIWFKLAKWNLLISACGTFLWFSSSLVLAVISTFYTASAGNLDNFPLPGNFMLPVIPDWLSQKQAKSRQGSLELSSRVRMDFVQMLRLQEWL